MGIHIPTELKSEENVLVITPRELSVLPYFLRYWGALWKEIFDTSRSKKSQLLLQSQL